MNAQKLITAKEACPRCVTKMTPTCGTLRLPVNGEEVVVPRAAHLRCRRCKEVVLPLEGASRLGERAIALYRRKHALLSAADIRAIRERLALTQGELARLLGLGLNTVSRWEAGRNVQTAAMDLLLRLLGDVPGVRRYLEARAASRELH